MLKMFRKPRFRRPGQSSRWSVVREALNTAASIGTVLIGVGTLWITARISGLEDYFQSELSARNGQLASLIRQNEQASDALRSGELQLAVLRSRTDEAIVTALATQAQLSGSLGNLVDLQEEVVRERDNVGKARSELATIQAQTNEQRKSLASLYAREAFDRSILVATGVTVRSLQETDFREPRPAFKTPIGRMVLESLSRLADGKAGDQQTYPFYQQIVRNLPVVCPGFVDREIVYLEIPTRTTTPPIGDTRRMSNREIQALVERKMQDDTASIIDRTNVIASAIDASTKSNTEFMHYTSACLCAAAISGGQEKQVVCPAE